MIPLCNRPNWMAHIGSKFSGANNFALSRSRFSEGKGIHRVALSGVCLLLSSLSSLLSIGCLGLVVVVVVVVVAAQVCKDRGLVLDSHFVVEDSLWRGLLCTGTCASQSPPM